MSRSPFPGSYRHNDVDFLLEIIDMQSTSLDEKERLLRSGQRHYSEMLGPEHEPSADYLAAYETALAANCDRFARDVLALARHIDRTCAGEIWLASLARAGTPVGVLLVRVLRTLFGRSAHHVSLSIVVDRGIDVAALDWLRAQASGRDEAILFIDGWTGKGTIAAELRASIAAYNDRCDARLNPQLYVVADLCGVTPHAATNEDYLIPSSLLGAVVSGLLSRTILPRDRVGTDQWHCARFYDELRPHDRSLAFVDRVEQHIHELDIVTEAGLLKRRDLSLEAAQASAALADWQRRLELKNLRYLKPGIGEATRVLLRRLPRLLIVRELGDPNVRHMVLLATERKVSIEVDAHLPWRALAAIVEEG
jgi:hypothetical protein